MHMIFVGCDGLARGSIRAVRHEVPTIHGAFVMLFRAADDTTPAMADQLRRRRGYVQLVGEPPGEAWHGEPEFGPSVFQEGLERRQPQFLSIHKVRHPVADDTMEIRLEPRQNGRREVALQPGPECCFQMPVPAAQGNLQRCFICCVPERSPGPERDELPHDTDRGASFRSAMQRGCPGCLSWFTGVGQRRVIRHQSHDRRPVTGPCGTGQAMAKRRMGAIALAQFGRADPFGRWVRDQTALDQSAGTNMKPGTPPET